MGRWRTLGGELSALGTLALSLPLGRLLPRERFDPAAPHPTPVVLVHGFLGDPSNFLVLRSFLASHGVRSFASFSYPPRLDYQRLAPRLRQMIARVCHETGSPRVDVVGHSLGGLVARYLIEMGDGGRVGRLVTLGSPYFSDRRPSRELAILGAHDPLVPAPDVARGRVVIVEDCGHWNLLYHPAALGAVARYLVRSAEAAIGSPTARAAA
jgi:pimeloyl-ACP methyl ester carboxylesterase